jgi:LemA protein
LVSVERYPELKANQNFLELQSQLEGSENRITVERQKFNEITQVYNSKIRTFPNNITAGMFGFTKKGYFEADAGAAKAPNVQF